ncbi:ribbon-helix-helix domain-containing protein [Azospirillum sp. sgz302134]
MDHAEPQSITMGRHRTTVRLEPAIWEALNEIAAREGRTVNELCTELRERWHVSKTRNFTASLRRFVLAYFRTAVAHADPEPGAGRAAVHHALNTVGAPGPSRPAGSPQRKERAPNRLEWTKAAPRACNTSATDSL